MKAERAQVDSGRIMRFVNAHGFDCDMTPCGYVLVLTRYTTKDGKHGLFGDVAKTMQDAREILGY